MKEQLLQFIWRYQYFNRPKLYTETGEALQILSPGDLNTHQGPDFLNAAIRIGNTYWAGNIELHIKTSDWDRHAHQHDRNYRNVILHVVWENDMAAGGALPLLVLQHRVPKWLLGKYSEWMNHRRFIACEGQLPQVSGNTWEGWKQRLVEERLYRKSLFIRDALAETHQHWEEVTWWLLARNFGLPVNTGSFEAMARNLPISVLARHRGNVGQLEALLLGQAGLLEEAFGEEYPLFLQKEFRYLRKKYRLPAPSSPIFFLRMRPGNAPLVRLAQLAGLLSRCAAWFVTIKEADSPEDLKPLLRVTASAYWDRHYGWGTAGPGREAVGQTGMAGNAGDGMGKALAGAGDNRDGMGNALAGARDDGAVRPKRIGRQMMDSILINTAAPLLFAYGWLRGEKTLRDKALRWLAAIPPEKNALIAGWGHQGVYGKHAADTQALLELKTRYCDPKKCLQCAIGHFLLGEATPG